MALLFNFVIFSYDNVEQFVSALNTDDLIFTYNSEIRGEIARIWLYNLQGINDLLAKCIDFDFRERYGIKYKGCIRITTIMLLDPEYCYSIRVYDEELRQFLPACQKFENNQKLNYKK